MLAVCQEVLYHCLRLILYLLDDDRIILCHYLNQVVSYVLSSVLCPTNSLESHLISCPWDRWRDREVCWRVWDGKWYDYDDVHCQWTVLVGSELWELLALSADFSVLQSGPWDQLISTAGNFQFGNKTHFWPRPFWVFSEKLVQNFTNPINLACAVEGFLEIMTQAHFNGHAHDIRASTNRISDPPTTFCYIVI